MVHSFYMYLSKVVRGGFRICEREILCGMCPLLLAIPTSTCSSLELQALEIEGCGLQSRYMTIKVVKLD